MKKIINYIVENEEWQQAQEKAFNKLNKTANIDGFRPGKAPRNIFEKKYGKQEILFEAADELINKRFREIMKQGEILPILEPKVEPVEITEEKFEVNFTFITKPEVTLGEYKNLKVKKEEVKVTKEEVEHEIGHILQDYAELIEKDGKVENGDIAVIDFEGFKDDVAFEGGKGENYSLTIGSNTFIPGFEEGLIGLSKGEEKDLELTFPEEYHSEELKGQKVVFKVKVNDIKTRKVPELDKEFFEDLDIEGINTKEDLEKMITEEITARKEVDAENKYIEDLLSTASKKMKVEIDAEIIEEEQNKMYEDFLDRLAMQGLTEEIYLQYANLTKEKILEEMKPEAEKRIKYSYLINAIIEEEKIEVTDEEVEKRIEEDSKKYNISSEDYLKEVGGFQTLKYDISLRKAIDCMKESN